MFERDNLIGVALLGLCAVVAVVLVFGIATGTRFVYTGPEWLAWALAILFIGASLYGLFPSARRWPNPLTGQRGRRWPWQRDRPPGDRR